MQAPIHVTNLKMPPPSLQVLLLKQRAGTVWNSGIFQLSQSRTVHTSHYEEGMTKAKKKQKQKQNTRWKQEGSERVKGKKKRKNGERAGKKKGKAICLNLDWQSKLSLVLFTARNGVLNSQLSGENDACVILHMQIIHTHLLWILQTKDPRHKIHKE